MLGHRSPSLSDQNTNRIITDLQSKMRAREEVGGCQTLHHVAIVTATLHTDKTFLCKAPDMKPLSSVAAFVNGQEVQCVSNMSQACKV